MERDICSGLSQNNGAVTSSDGASDSSYGSMRIMRNLSPSEEFAAVVVASAVASAFVRFVHWMSRIDDVSSRMHSKSVLGLLDLFYYRKDEAVPDSLLHAYKTRSRTHLGRGPKSSSEAAPGSLR